MMLMPLQYHDSIYELFKTPSVAWTEVRVIDSIMILVILLYKYREVRVCLELYANEILSLYDRHHKVSPSPNASTNAP